jgi:hypothetical protein
MKTIVTSNFCFKISLIIFFLLSLISVKIYSQAAAWQSYGPGGGGALYSPVISPHNPQEIFFPTDMSDLFHTTDFGASYTTVHFKYITAGPMTNVQFTNEQNILYTINQNEFGNFPVKSTDGGISWNNISTDPTSAGAYFLFTDDENYNKLLVADYTNIYYSTNGGTSFSTVFQGNSGTWGSYIACTLWDGNDTYICLPDGLLVSKNNQVFAHETYPGIPSNEYIVSCAAAKSNGTIRFIAVTNSSCWPGMTGDERTGFKGVYVLDYGSGNWVKKISGLTANDNPFFASMAKNNKDIAYISGEDMSQYGPSVYKTTDGGNSWTNVFNLQNNKNIRTGWSGAGGDRDWSYGEYALGFSACLTNPDYLIVTDLGFAHISSDGGTSWEQAYVRKSDENPANSPTPKGKIYHSVGLEQTSCWYLTWSDADNIFASYTDIKGCRSTDAGDSWSYDYTGHSDNTMYFALKHPVSGNLYAATSTVHDMYASTYLTDSRIDGGGGKILYSTNKGKDWQILHDFAHPVIWLALDPQNPNRMYASVIHSTLGGIYVSNNINQGAASSWTKLAVPQRTQGHPLNILVLNDGSLLCTYSGRMSNDRKTFYPSSGVFYSTDGGTIWLDRSDANMQYWTKDIVVDPNDPSQNTWYVGVYSGWGGAANNKGGLYKTTNRGVSWTKVLTLARVESCTINPSKTNEMYVTTEYEGLYFTNNLNSPSPNFSLVDSYHFKHPERVFYNPYKPEEVWVTSFGYGIVKSKASGIKVTSVQLTPKSDSLFIGDSVQLTATILPADADNKNINFSSINAVATVSQSGLVKAIMEGSTGIVVRTEDGGFTDTCRITVNKKIIRVTSVALNKRTDTLKTGDTEQLNYTILPANATDTNVTWHSSLPSVANVSQTGLVNTFLEGIADIIITTSDGNLSDTCIVTVQKPSSVNDDIYLSNVLFFPNPVSGFIELPEALLNNNAQVSIYSSIGVIVYQGNATKRIDIRFLSPGIYFLKVKDKVYKFVKI